MKNPSRALALRFVLGLLCCGALGGGAAAADGASVPLANWPVPRTAAGGLHPLTDVTGALPFIGIAPCRLADTRDAGMPAGYGPPALLAAAVRTFRIANRCGIPAGAGAVSFNFTAVGASGPGDLRVFPTGGATPLVSTLNYVTGQTVANAAIVPLSSLGDLSIQADVSGTDLVIDVNGYFTYYLNAQEQLYVNALVTGEGAVKGTNVATADGSSGVHGLETSTTGHVYGVLGELAAGSDTLSAGVYGRSGDRFGPAGVMGDVVGLANPSYVPAFGFRSGVAGRGDRNGMIGSAEFPPGSGSYSLGVMGLVLNAANTDFAAYGVLGRSNGGATPQVYAVWGGGDYGGTGMKFFVEPHPTEPGRVIRYVALEGPEAGTYFRGRGRFVDRRAVIPVPEDFRLVTDAEGLTVQVTPIGELALTAAESIGLDAIELRSSRDVEFSYLVQGVRRTFKNHTPIVESPDFIPESATSRMPLYLSEEQKRNLIRSGIYNEDGTVNLRTAERLGWARAWREMSRR